MLSLQGILFPSSVCLNIRVLILMSICDDFSTCNAYRTLYSTLTHLAVGICSAKPVHVVLLLSTSSRVSSRHLRRPSALYAERYVSNPTCCQASFLLSLLAAVELIFSVASP